MATLLIHRNPDCARCARIVRMHHRLDWLGRIADTTQPPADAQAPRMGEILVRELASGRLLQGVEAVRAIARAVPLYWPLLPLLRVPAIARRADADARGLVSACDGGPMVQEVKVSTRPAIVVVALWAILLLALNARGAFVTTPGRPPLPLLLAVVVPPLLFGIAHAWSASVRGMVLAMDLRVLTAMQGWRLVGTMFLVLMSFGMLPGTFAWPAGVGDAIVGAYAPFVLAAIMRRSPGWQRHVLWLNVLGLIDFVGAIGGGVLSGRSPIAVFHTAVSTDIMQSLPLSLIPTFFVPFWIVLHIISLIQLRHLPELTLPGSPATPSACGTTPPSAGTAAGAT